MNDALLIVDARGAIVRLNRSGRELLCLDSASLVFGQPLEQQRLEQWPATAREIAAALVPVIDALRSGRSVADVEIELRSGQLRVLSLGASLLRSPGGALQGGVIAFRDITGQRDLERLREDIFTMAWHDMKTPITVIRGHAELLLQQLSCDDRDRKTLEADAALIVEHTDHLSELLATLFDVSCLEAGLLSLSPRPPGLGALGPGVAEGMPAAPPPPHRVLARRSAFGGGAEQRIPP